MAFQAYDIVSTAAVKSHVPNCHAGWANSKADSRPACALELTSLGEFKEKSLEYGQRFA